MNVQDETGAETRACLACAGKHRAHTCGRVLGRRKRRSPLAALENELAFNASGRYTPCPSFPHGPDMHPPPHNSKPISTQKKATKGRVRTKMTAKMTARLATTSPSPWLLPPHTWCAWWWGPLHRQSPSAGRAAWASRRQPRRCPLAGGEVQGNAGGILINFMLRKK